MPIIKNIITPLRALFIAPKVVASVSSRPIVSFPKETPRKSIAAPISPTPDQEKMFQVIKKRINNLAKDNVDQSAFYAEIERHLMMQIRYTKDLPKAREAVRHIINHLGLLHYSPMVQDDKGRCVKLPHFSENPLYLSFCSALNHLIHHHLFDRLIECEHIEAAVNLLAHFNCAHEEILTHPIAAEVWDYLDSCRAREGRLNTALGRELVINLSMAKSLIEIVTFFRLTHQECEREVISANEDKRQTEKQINRLVRNILWIGIEHVNLNGLNPDVAYLIHNLIKDSPAVFKSISKSMVELIDLSDKKREVQLEIIATLTDKPKLAEGLRDFCVQQEEVVTLDFFRAAVTYISKPEQEVTYFPAPQKRKTTFSQEMVVDVSDSSLILEQLFGNAWSFFYSPKQKEAEPTQQHVLVL